MIRIIQSHNLLNGIWFATLEFGFIALVIAPFAIYYLLHDQWLYAFVFGGIALNCLPVIWYGLRAIQNGEAGSGTVWDKNARQKLVAENPHMLRDTLRLAGGILIPLLVLVIVAAEALRSDKTHE